MQIQIFTVPIIGGEGITDQMNVFLRSKKILQVERQLVMLNDNAFWCFCIQYLEGGQEKVNSKRDKVDYRQILDEASFKRFSRMRAIRKQLAEEEAIPAYAVLTDEEMAGLARIEGNLTIAKMKGIKGIGQKKVEKFGTHFINLLSPDEKS